MGHKYSVAQWWHPPPEPNEGCVLGVRIPPKAARRQCLRRTTAEKISPCFILVSFMFVVTVIAGLRTKVEQVPVNRKGKRGISLVKWHGGVGNFWWFRLGVTNQPVHPKIGHPVLPVCFPGLHRSGDAYLVRMFPQYTQGTAVNKDFGSSFHLPKIQAKSPFPHSASFFNPKGLIITRSSGKIPDTRICVLRPGRQLVQTGGGGGLFLPEIVPARVHATQPAR